MGVHKPNEPDEAVLMMDKIKIGFIGASNESGDDYYFTTARIPAMIDLSNTVLHLFPWEEEDRFGLDMVIRKYDPSKRKERK